MKTPEKIKAHMENVPVFVPAIKSGRAWNGFEKDKGVIIHLVEALPSNTSGYWGDKSAFGIIPGKRSNGWHQVDRELTCPKCLKIKEAKYERIEPEKTQSKLLTAEEMIERNPPFFQGDIVYLMESYAGVQTASTYTEAQVIAMMEQLKQDCADNAECEVNWSRIDKSTILSLPVDKYLKPKS